MKEVREQNMELLANEANNAISLNKYLHQTLSLYKKYIKLTRDTMTNSLSSNINSLLDIFNSYINVIEKDYINLKEEYDNNYYPKYQSLYDECLSDITMGKPVLNQYRAEDFVLDYLKNEKDDIINRLKTSIKQSKEFHLFREPKRDSLIDIKTGNKEIEKVTNELQQNMLYECKKCNKFSYRIKYYNSQIPKIKNNIRILKNYIKDEKSKNKIDNNSKNNNNSNSDNNSDSSPRQKDGDNKINIENKVPDTNNKIFTFGKEDLKRSINIGFLNPSFGKKTRNEKDPNNSDENRGFSGREKIKRKKTNNFMKKSINKVITIKRKKNKIIQQFKKVEDLFNLSEEEGEKEKLIDDELHSDDETVFSKKIKPKKQLTTSLRDEVKQIIPSINLKQIEFNKIKIMKEADVYSLQRRQHKSENIDNNIKEIKKEIEKMKEKLSIMQQKEKIMKEYIEKVKDNYNLFKSIRVETSVANQPIESIRQSVLGLVKINEEENDNDNCWEGEGVGSDYSNEEDEYPDKVDIFDYKSKDMKRSVFVGGYGKKKNKNGGIMLKKSVQDGYFINNLRKKIKKRASSK